jgi:tRNA pseudouridine(38-40) synthase
LNLAFRDTVQFIPMSHWKLTLAYDGTPYRGWQIQPNLPTVQGLLSDAIHRTTGERVLPQGSGRTDAGVHALAQVASFSLAAPIPAANLHRALNRCLPPSVRVLAVEAVPPTFHARHSALRKTYEYRIFPLCAPSLEPRSSILEPGCICPPTLAPTVWPCPWPLDLSALNQAAAHVLGTHDFTTFAAVDPDLTHRSADSSQTSVIPTEGLRESIQDSVIPTEGGAFAAAVEGPPHLAFAPVLRRERGASAPRIIPLGRKGFSPGPSPQPTTSNQQPTTPVRTITHSQWRISGGLLIYRVTADGFLHHMVRNLVGTFVQAGAHRLDPASIPALLAARNRAAAGPTAPASGLFLVSVDYPAPTALSSLYL